VDVTKYKNAISELQKAEAHYKDLFENINDVIFTHELNEERFASTNKALEKMLRIEYREILGTPWTAFLKPSVRHLVSGYMEALQKNGHFDGIVCFLDAGGNECYVDIKSVVFKDNNKKVVRGIGRNVTEFIKTRKQYEILCESVISAMTKLVEHRDPYTAGHKKRVAEIAVAVGKRLGLSKEEIKLLHTAALLHDIGKIAVPVEILTKPRSLTCLERKFIDLHPEKGKEILKEIPFPGDVAEVVGQHHECLDGSGYPAGLGGEQILLPARIIAVADVFEAMTSHRPYRPAFSIEEALEELISKSGYLYDKDAVEVLVELV